MRNRTRPRLVAAAFLAGALIFALPSSGEAQILKKLKDVAKEAAEDEATTQVDQFVRGKVQCVFNDLECIEGAGESGEEYVLTDPEGEVLVDEEGMPVSDQAEAYEIMGAEPEAGPPDLSTMQTGAPADLDEAESGFEFEPGERVLFEDDFAGDNLGDFPRSLELRNGNWDIVEWNGRRWLRLSGPRHAALEIPLTETLPEKFTIEFEAYFSTSNQHILVSPALPPPGRGRTAIPGHVFQVGVGGSRTGVRTMSGDGVRSLSNSEEVGQGPVPIRIMVDGGHAKMFVGTRRVANIPNAEFHRADRIYVHNLYNASAKNPMLIGSLRIAAGGRDLYDVLAEEGRFTTRGIQFEVNSAQIRPESSQMLADIGGMLLEHPELRLSIEGHTDADGDEEHNLDLSERRSTAVKVYLTDNFDIAADRLETEGFGEYVPVSSNDTAEGKRLNRRVELVRLEEGP